MRYLIAITFFTKNIPKLQMTKQRERSCAWPWAWERGPCDVCQVDWCHWE